METTYRRTRIVLSEKTVDYQTSYKCIEFHFNDCVCHTPITVESYNAITEAGEITPSTIGEFLQRINNPDRYFDTIIEHVSHAYDVAVWYRNHLKPGIRNKKTRPDLRFKVNW